MLLLIVPALGGARLWFLAAHWRSLFARQRRRIWRRSQGGASLHGGLLLAVACSPVVLAALDLPFGAFWDATTPMMLTGLLFTRVGCLLHGCCCGRPSTARWAVVLRDHAGNRQRRVPTQLLEMLIALVLIAATLPLLGAPPFPGGVFLMVVAAYGVTRLVLDPMRVHTRADLRASRIVSMFLTAAAILAILIGSLT
jgi:prolipoprotein diacylglyceryltransferase